VVDTSVSEGLKMEAVCSAESLVSTTAITTATAPDLFQLTVNTPEKVSERPRSLVFPVVFFTF